MIRHGTQKERLDSRQSQTAFSVEATTLWDEVSWEKAPATHTEESYERYIAAHPEGRYGADANATFPGDWSPLYVAIVNRKADVVFLLLKRGVKLPFHYSGMSLHNTSDESKELLKAHFGTKSIKR